MKKQLNRIEAKLDEILRVETQLLKNTANVNGSKGLLQTIQAWSDNTNGVCLSERGELVYDGTQSIKPAQDIIINNLPSEPDWSTAPEWAQWFAIDDDSEGYWFSYKPQIIDGTWGGMVNDDDKAKFEGVFNNKNWQSSLRQRPKSEQVNITASLNVDTDGYLAGKKSFISAYVDLLLARMAKEDRYSDDDCVGEFPAPDAPDVCIYSRDGESEHFAIILGKETSGYSTRLFTWVLGSRDNSFGFFNLDDTDFSSESESWLRTITELEAVEFRAAMEAVYG